MGKMKIASISDVHGQWHKIHYPPADVLVCAGDLLANIHTGWHTKDEEAELQLEEVEAFGNFLKKLKDIGRYKEVVVVAGNHDWAFERRNKECRELLEGKVIYLQDDSAVIDGVKFHGSPWQRWFWDWAFNLPNHNENFARYRAHAREIYDKIDEDVNVLVTHGPPYAVGIKPSEGLLGLDYVPRGENVGDPYMMKRIEKIAFDHGKLKAHFFGHIHCGYGQYKCPATGVHFVNTAICTEAYNPDNLVPVIEIDVDSNEDPVSGQTE